MRVWATCPWFQQKRDIVVAVTRERQDTHPIEGLDMAVTRERMFMSVVVMVVTEVPITAITTAVVVAAAESSH